MHRFKNILAVCDRPDSSGALLDRVRWLAEVNQAPVTLVDVAETGPGDLARALGEFARLPASRIEQEVLEIYQTRLDELAGPLRAAGIEVRTAVEPAPASIRLVGRVLRDTHDLLIKDAQRDPDWPVLRGLDMQLLRKCPCPVWIRSGPGETRARRLLAAVDTMSGDPEHDALNRTILEFATFLARQDHARLDVVSVWTVPEESSLRHPRIKIAEEEIHAILAAAEARSARRLERLLGEFADQRDRMRVVHLKGSPAEAIVEHARRQNSDTIVMGTVARTGLPGFLMGNTAETILNRVTCSVLAVKPDGFATPIEAEIGARAPTHA